MKRAAWTCVALLVVLAGCGNPSSPGGDSPGPTPSASATVSASEHTTAPAATATPTPAAQPASRAPILLEDRGTLTDPVWVHEPFVYTYASRLIDPNAGGEAYFAGARGYIDIVVVATQWGSEFFELRGEDWYYVPYPSGIAPGLEVLFRDGDRYGGAIVDTKVVYSDLVLDSSIPVPEGLAVPEWRANELALPTAWGDLVGQALPYREVSDALSLRMVDRPAHTWFPVSAGVREKGLMVFGPAGLVMALNSGDPQGVREVTAAYGYDGAAQPLMRTWYCGGVWSPVTTITNSPDSHWFPYISLADGRTLYAGTPSNPFSQAVADEAPANQQIFESRSYHEGTDSHGTVHARGNGEPLVWGLPTGRDGEWFVWRNDVLVSLNNCSG